METSIKISAAGLSRYFGHSCAVHDISFSLKRGEVLGLLGPNGAGKSTTLRMLTGNLAPSEGRITINGIDIIDRPGEAKRALGYLPEQPPLYRDQSVDEYLRYCARLHRIARPQLASAITEAKQRCGLEAVGQRLIGNLSKGYQQRVGIAQAIVHHPEVIILDEPTVGLDPLQIREIRTLIRALGRDYSVILSSHILPEVQATCDRVLIINRGELVVSETIEGLNRRMETSSLLLGLAHPPTEGAFNDLAGVVNVEPLGSNRFRITHTPDTTPAEAIARRAVERDWGLVELTPERRTLEDVFVAITCDEPADEHHQEAAK